MIILDTSFSIDFFKGDEGTQAIIRTESVKHVYELLTFLEACILKGIIQKDELIEIVSLLKKRDFYEFSDNDKRELFSYFELKGER